MGIHLSFIPLDGDDLPSIEVEQNEPKEFQKANHDKEDNQETPTNPENTSNPTAQTLKLRAILAFEDGRVEAWECVNWAVASDIRLGRASRGGWKCRWREKGHNEASESAEILSWGGWFGGLIGKGDGGSYGHDCFA